MNVKRTGTPLIAGLGLLFVAAQGALAQGLPTILWQRDDHSASVTGVAFSADGSDVLSCANITDSTFRLWSALDGSPDGVFSLAPHGAHSIAAVPGSGLIAVGYVVSGYPPGGVAGIWDPDVGAERFTAGGCFVDVSPDGALLASGGGGVNRHLDITRIADGAGLQHIYTGSYIHDVAFAPAGALVATAGSDNAARIWSSQTGQLVTAIPAHDDDVNALAFSPDGQLLATGAGGFDATDDSSIKIWNAHDGTPVRTLSGFGDWVYALAFSPDGTTLLSSGRTGSQGMIKLWNVADGALIRTYDASALDLAWSADGATFAYGTAFGEVVLAVSPVTPTSATGLASAVAFAAAPNPVRAGTHLSFELPRAAGVRLGIYDAAGRRVATLLEGRRAAGTHAVRWDARDGAGERVAPGVYFARLFDGVDVVTRKLVVVR